MHTIDELAHISGLPSRTIRFYNTQGLLPAPVMQGRVAYYDDEHLVVLTIIKQLKEKQNLPLETIRQMLEIRASQGEVMMNLALKQRLLRPLNAGQDVRLSREALLKQTGAKAEYIDELTKQGLLFPLQVDGEEMYSGDDVLLIELYQRLDYMGLPIALPALIRFQLRQLVRSELAAFDQHVYPLWRDEGLSQEQQAEQLAAILTLTDTLISIMHRKMVNKI
ncbi:MAG TPA: MerR family transcriptional regulator [Ktedonobacteraceae bacterium]|nr:MerR family transcriptional regulator [Ktedonobacteraceae bacterium]